MWNLRSLILSIFLVSIVLLIGCRKTQPEPEPQSSYEAKEASHSPEEKAAIEAAQAWLELVDVKDFSKSWDEAAEYFKNAVTKENWQNTLDALRTPLGRMLWRELKSARYTTTVPGAPDGRYVIIQYDTSFENKDAAIETVTPMLDKDGNWRVSGYHIK
jgi:hypothetical protein